MNFIDLSPPVEFYGCYHFQIYTNGFYKTILFSIGNNIQ